MEEKNKKKMGVYKIVLRETGEVIYVGKTKTSFKKRIESHFAARQDERKFEPFVKLGCDAYYYCMDNKTQVDIMEKALIDKYKPILNRAYNEEGAHPAIHVDELEWVKYDYVQKENVEYTVSDFVKSIKIKINGHTFEVVCHYEYNELKYWTNYFIKEMEKAAENKYVTRIYKPDKKYIPLFINWDYNSTNGGGMNVVSCFTSDYYDFMNESMIFLKYLIQINDNNGKMSNGEYAKMIEYFKQYSESYSHAIKYINFMLGR